MKRHTVMQAIARANRVPGAESDNIYDISAIDFERLRAEFARLPNKHTTLQSVKERIETKLEQMVQRNPSRQRQDLLARYQAIIAEYNQETDRATIEQTFDALMKLLEDLSEEENRAVREGLTEEYLAVFDLLCAEKDNLDTRTRNRIKTLAQSLIDAIKAQIQPIDNWRDKNATRSQLETFIFNYLWDEEKGLPADTFAMHEIQPLADRIYLHVYERYPSVVDSVYAA